jgi:predicted transcriptional regulator
MKNEEQSISQNNRDVYNLILKQLHDFFEKDTVRLVHYLHDEKHMSLAAIARILDTTQQSVHRRYFVKHGRSAK